MWRLLLLLPFVAVSMLAAAGGKDREKEQRAQSLFSHHAISAPHPPPPREMLYADLKVVGVYEVEVYSLLAHSTRWKALEGDPLKPAAGQSQGTNAF